MILPFNSPSLKSFPWSPFQKEPANPALWRRPVQTQVRGEQASQALGTATHSLVSPAARRGLLGPSVPSRTCGRPGCPQLPVVSELGDACVPCDADTSRCGLGDARCSFSLEVWTREHGVSSLCSRPKSSVDELSLDPACSIGGKVDTGPAPRVQGTGADRARPGAVPGLEGRS